MRDGQASRHHRRVRRRQPPVEKSRRVSCGTMWRGQRALSSISRSAPVDTPAIHLADTSLARAQGLLTEDLGKDGFVLKRVDEKTSSSRRKRVGHGVRSL